MSKCYVRESGFPRNFNKIVSVTTRIDSILGLVNCNLQYCLEQMRLSEAERPNMCRRLGGLSVFLSIPFSTYRTVSAAVGVRRLGRSARVSLSRILQV